MTTVFQHVGRYSIHRELGRGGMATVFLATDGETNTDVALKQVPVGVDREAREIAEAEEWGAQLQAHFSKISECVPKVFDYWTDGDYFYIAMEYVDGVNLSDLLAQPLPADRAVSIAIDLCAFLDAAHTFKVTIAGRPFTSLHHNDIKPRNVRITPDGKVKVLDFGIAKALSLSRKVTRNDFGSVPYLSPERLESSDVDAYSDLWAIGVVLYEMLRGAPPFTASDTRLLERRILSRTPPPSLHGLCPAGLEAIVVKLLAPRTSDRYASAAAVRDDLLRFQSGQRTHAEDEGWPLKAIDQDATARTRVESEDERTRRTTRPKAEAVAASKPAGVATPTGVKALSRPSQPPHRRWLVKTALLIAALILVMNEISVGASANRLVRTLSGRQLTELDSLWDQYDHLNTKSLLRVGVVGLRHALVNRTVELGERVIGNYRTASPTLREAQWLTMQSADIRALGVDPDNRQLKGAARYCEGHLHRIAGEAKQVKHDYTGARQEFTEAITAFREAAELRPNWPDPFLGLMRTFIYGLDDLDRGVDALRQAERFGYSSGSREIAQLADGYRARGDRLARNARTLRGLPQEQVSLEKAAEAFRTSLELYAKVADFARGAANMRLAQRGLDQIERRLAEIGDQPHSDGLTPRI